MVTLGPGSVLVLSRPWIQMGDPDFVKMGLGTQGVDPRSLMPGKTFGGKPERASSEF